MSQKWDPWEATRKWMLSDRTEPLCESYVFPSPCRKGSMAQGKGYGVIGILQILTDITKQTSTMQSQLL